MDFLKVVLKIKPSF